MRPQGSNHLAWRISKAKYHGVGKTLKCGIKLTAVTVYFKRKQLLMYTGRQFQNDKPESHAFRRFLCQLWTNSFKFC